LGFTVPREEFFVETYVAFRVDAGCGLTWGPLDGAVDGFVLEVFIDVAAIAGDPCFWGPAVYVPPEGVRWVREKIH
jgi:hypothetical protein